MQALADEHPEVAVNRRELAVAHLRVGSLLTRAGPPRLAEFESSRSLLEDLAKANPNVLTYRFDLASTLNSRRRPPRPGPGRRGTRPLRPGRRPRRCAGRGPPDACFSLPLADALRRLARLRLDAGGRASPTGRRTVPGAARAAARVVLAGLRPSTLSAASGRDGRGPAAPRPPSCPIGRWTTSTRPSRWAIAARPNYRYEPALAPLRDRDDFRLLLLDLVFPADPFAR